MKKHFKKALACLMATAIAIPSIGHLRTYSDHNHNHEHDHYEATSGTEAQTPDVYLLLSGYVDAYPFQKLKSGKWTYKYKADGSAKFVGSSSSNSTLANIDKWKSTYSNKNTSDKLYLPKKVGDYYNRRL